MTGTVTKGLALRGDLDQYDGTLAGSRTDSTGGTLTGLKIGNAVDILQVFGAGLVANRTQATVNAAVTALTGTNIAFVLAPGSWTFDDDLTIAANFTVILPAGCTLEPASGKTLTLAGIVVREHTTYTGGAGTVTISGTDTLASQDTTTHYAADTGSADTYVMAPSPVVASYAAGQMYAFLAANANTGTSTLNVSALGAKALQKYDTTGALVELTSGDILASQLIHCRYDGTQFQLIPNIQINPSDSVTFGTITTTGTITTGGNIVSDTDSTDDLGSSSVRWANVYVDAINIANTGDVTGVATQAEMEAASSMLTLVAPGRAHFSPSAAKAWLHCSRSGGTPSLSSGSFNIASVGDGAAGITTVLIATDLSASTSPVLANATATGNIAMPYSLATTGFTVRVADTGNTVADAVDFTATVFGDHA